MIHTLIILFVIKVWSASKSYDFQCPSLSQWRIRAKSMCVHERDYSCLFDVNLQINVYRDKCIRPRIVGPGYKYVFQPNPNRDSCSLSLYQPFIFNTTGYSNCAFQKSFCNSEGQTTYQNGTTRSDRTCVCNKNLGYNFVKHPENECNCNPSSTDCSCYFGITPNSRNTSWKDLKCYGEIDITSSRSREYALNKSQVLRTNDFDNFKCNIDGATKEYRTKAAIVILILVLAYTPVAVGIYTLQRIVRQWIPMYYKTASKQGLSKYDKDTIKELIRSETEQRYFVKIMIVGKESVGKTCLLKNLLKESKEEVTSTVGVDIIMNRCKIDIDNGEWIIDRDKCDDTKDRITRALAKHRSKNNEALEHAYNTSKDKKCEASDLLPVQKSNDDSIDVQRITSEQEFNNDMQRKTIRDPNMTTTNTKNPLVDIQSEYETPSLVMPTNLLSEVLSFSSSVDSSSKHQYASCGLWDFAGKREFYATHQAFLTSNAIYILVADKNDGSENQDVKPCATVFEKEQDYIDFWFQSVHCHRTETIHTNEAIDSPVILVFTGKDTYTEENLLKKENELNIQIQANEIYQTYRHNQNMFLISNTKDYDEDFEQLRDTIYKLAQKMPNWGKQMPLKWILLEHLIEINKKKGRKFVMLKDMVEMAQHPEIEIFKEDEVLFFLHFQHEVGNVMFFEDMNDMIIINPQWLADAFRCLVSDRLNNVGFTDSQDFEDFRELHERGKLSDRLITILFKSKSRNSFDEEKQDLLKVMNRFDILINIEDKDYYMMPSMMPISSCRTVWEKVGISENNCQRTSWFCLEFSFLPPVFFNHLSAWFISKYHPSKEIDGSELFALYKGICVFDFDDSGCDKLLMTMSTNTIVIEVVSLAEEKKDLGNTFTCLCNEFVKKIEKIKKRYKLEISYAQSVGCGKSYFFTNEMTFKQIGNIRNSPCNIDCSKFETINSTEPETVCSAEHEKVGNTKPRRVGGTQPDTNHDTDPEANSSSDFIATTESVTVNRTNPYTIDSTEPETVDYTASEHETEPDKVVNLKDSLCKQLGDTRNSPCNIDCSELETINSTEPEIVCSAEHETVGNTKHGRVDGTQPDTIHDPDTETSSDFIATTEPGTVNRTDPDTIDRTEPETVDHTTSEPKTEPDILVSLKDSIFKEQEECDSSCEGLAKADLKKTPTDKNLGRLAQQLTIKECRELVTNLGLKYMDWDDIEYTHDKHPTNIRILALQSWKYKNIKDKPSTKLFEHLLEALQNIGQKRHLLCKVLRKDTDLIDCIGTDKDRILEIPHEEVLNDLSKKLSDCALHLGIELELTSIQIQDSIKRNSNDRYFQTREILRQWKNADSNPTVYKLMLALKRVDNEGLNYLLDFYHVK